MHGKDDSMAKREPTKKEIIVLIAAKRPWLIPILYTIHSIGTATLDDVRESLGIRTQIAKRALWWLQKYDVIMKTGDKYMVKQGYRSVLDELFLDLCRRGNYFLIKFGATYLVVSVKRTRISSYTVPEKYVAQLMNLEALGRKVNEVREVSKILNIPPKLASRVLRVKNMLLECRG